MGLGGPIPSKTELSYLWRDGLYLYGTGLSYLWWDWAVPSLARLNCPISGGMDYISMGLVCPISGGTELAYLWEPWIVPWDLDVFSLYQDFRSIPVILWLVRKLNGEALVPLSNTFFF